MGYVLVEWSERSSLNIALKANRSRPLTTFWRCKDRNFFWNFQIFQPLFSVLKKKILLTLFIQLIIYYTLPQLRPFLKYLVISFLPALRVIPKKKAAAVCYAYHHVTGGHSVPPIITKIVRCDLKIHATKISFTGEKVVWTGIWVHSLVSNLILLLIMTTKCEEARKRMDTFFRLFYLISNHNYRINGFNFVNAF